jgi:hypothetical protein
MRTLSKSSTISGSSPSGARFVPVINSLDKYSQKTCINLLLHDAICFDKCFIPAFGISHLSQVEHILHHEVYGCRISFSLSISGRAASIRNWPMR